MNYKPWFDDRHCRRIGKSSPRRLLVTLSSEQAASDLLQAARIHLRHADSSLATSLFFNPDLTPTEAEQAYLKRKERRERRAKMTSTSSDIAGRDDDVKVDNTTCGLNPLAPSFHTEA